MVLIGIHGAIGHGKTTLADCLQQVEPNSAHLESSTVIAETLDELHWALKEPFEDNPVKFVNNWMQRLPPILKNVVNVDITPAELSFSAEDIKQHPVRFEKLLEHASNLQDKPSLTRHIITPENKSQYRAGLQGLGGYLVAKVSPTIWYDEIARRVETEESKGRALCVVGGLRYPSDEAVIRKAGGIIIEVVRPNMPTRDTDDPTEEARKLIQNDAVVVNDDSIQKLELIAGTLLSDISKDTLQSTYTASQL